MQLGIGKLATVDVDGAVFDGAVVKAGHFSTL